MQIIILELTKYPVEREKFEIMFHLIIFETFVSLSFYLKVKSLREK